MSVYLDRAAAHVSSEMTMSGACLAHSEAQRCTCAPRLTETAFSLGSRALGQRHWRGVLPAVLPQVALQGQKLGIGATQRRDVGGVANAVQEAIESQLLLVHRLGAGWRCDQLHWPADHAREGLGHLRFGQLVTGQLDGPAQVVLRAVKDEGGEAAEVFKGEH